MVRPDPKPKPRRRRPVRVVDRDAIVRARGQARRCAGCGGPVESMHHVVGKGSPHFGDDVEANLIGVCGHGTFGCHAALHGIPYYDRSGHRRAPEDVRRRVGETIVAYRPDVVRYVLDKLGEAAGRDWLSRHYSVLP